MSVHLSLDSEKVVAGRYAPRRPGGAATRPRSRRVLVKIHPFILGIVVALLALFAVALAGPDANAAENVQEPQMSFKSIM